MSIIHCCLAIVLVHGRRGRRRRGRRRRGRRYPYHP
jgi:hypothetical protein